MNIQAIALNTALGVLSFVGAFGLTGKFLGKYLINVFIKIFLKGKVVLDKIPDKHLELAIEADIWKSMNYIESPDFDVLAETVTNNICQKFPIIAPEARPIIKGILNGMKSQLIAAFPQLIPEHTEITDSHVTTITDSNTGVGN